MSHLFILILIFLWFCSVIPVGFNIFLWNSKTQLFSQGQPEVKWSHCWVIFIGVIEYMSVKNKYINYKPNYLVIPLQMPTQNWVIWLFSRGASKSKITWELRPTSDLKEDWASFPLKISKFITYLVAESVLVQTLNPYQEFFLTNGASASECDHSLICA